VRDANNTPVAAVTVTWAAAGSGSMTPSQSSTDANGIATSSWTLGANAGAQTATATKTGLTGSPVTFTATAQIQGATQMALNGGDGQVGPATQALPTAIAVIAKDQNGAPVQGVSFSWSAANGGSVNPVTSASDASGIASTKWTLGPNAGNQTATATKTGLAGSPVTFHSVSQIQGATQLAMTAASPGNGQTDTVLATLPNPYRVIATDQDGTPVPGVIVDWAVTAGGGSVSATSSVTDATGVAVITHTFGATAGSQSVQATVTGLIGSPVTFTSTANPGVATVIAKNGGDNQTGSINTALATAQRVIVHDSHGNVVSQVPVTWVVGDGGGSVNQTSTTTGTNGVASTTRTLGPTVGVQTDTATSAGLSGSPLVFTATARQPVTVSVTVNNDFFNPAVVTVGVGDTVKWTWAAGAVTHNVTFQDGPTSGNKSTGTYIRVFTATGSYPYRCTIHSSDFTTGMVGSVTVQ
jgi:adhesin/invasin